ncbi:caspase family protein [Kitasatospora sp. NPDC094028]
MTDRVGRFSALLIGAADYRKAPLRFVHRDLQGLGKALEARGVEVRLSRPWAGTQVTANFVNGEVGSFLMRARAGDRLLVCLSGHGAHADGQDFLVPEDMHRGVVPYQSGCIAIDWRHEAERTKAAQVLFLIDACRQGFDEDAMGEPVGWSAEKMRAVASRKVARLYACAPGQVARFVTAEESVAASADGSFSLFSRAVRDVLVSHEGPLNLGQLRDGVQGRIDALHRDHRKDGWPQEVRVLTEAVHEDFVVVGELRTARAAAPVDSAVAPAVEQDAVVAKDPAKLMADALHQVVTSGRTEYLEEFAVVGSAADLLKLSGLAMLGPAVEAMWTAAARRRPVESLVELTGRLCGAGSIELAVRLMDVAVEDRPADDRMALLVADDLRAELAEPLEAAMVRVVAGLSVPEAVGFVCRLHDVDRFAQAVRLLKVPQRLEDLPELLDAVEATGLRGQARRLLWEAAGTDDPRTLERLRALLGQSGRDRDRDVVLTATAIGPMDRLIEWLAIGETRSGFAEDAALVLRRAMAHREDQHVLLIALRSAGQDEHVRTAHEEAVRIELPLLQVLLDRLCREGAEEDARAVLQCAVEPFRPAEVAGLVLLLRQYGPAELLPLVFAALCRASADQVADFLQAAQDDDGSLVGEAVSVLVERYPVAELSVLAETLVVRRFGGSASVLWQKALCDRPVADLLDLLESVEEADQPALLDRITAPRRSPADLAELVEMPGRPELRERLGDRAAVGLRAHDDGLLKDVLAELGARGWEAGSELLIRRIVRTRDPAQQADLAVRLERDGHGKQARALIAGACRERGASALEDLAARLLAGPYPRLGDQLLNQAARRWGARDLVRLARHLAATCGRTERQTTAQHIAFLLIRAVQLRRPESAADLLLAVDAEPQSIPVSMERLLDCYLTGCPPAEIVSRIIRLRGAQPGGRLAKGVSDVARRNAPALFRAAGLTGSEEATECLLTACGGDGSVQPAVLQGLLAELRTAGSHDDAARVRDTAVRSQPPDSVAEFLVLFHGEASDDFAAACAAVAGRPTGEVAAVLASPLGTKSALEACAVRYVQEADQDRWRALACELFARRAGELAAVVLGASRWSRSMQAVGDLFIDVDRRGLPPVAALSDLVAGLGAGQVVELLEHVSRLGASSGTFAALGYSLAQSSNAVVAWRRLQALGRYGLAAVLLDQAPWATDLVVWYRSLTTSPVEIDRAAALEAVGADRPISEIVASLGRSSALRATAILFRPPQDVAALLAALDSPGVEPVLTELWRLLAAARSASELVLLIETLTTCGQVGDADRIIEMLISREAPARAGEILEAGAWTQTRATAGAVARSTARTGISVGFIRSLVQAGCPRGAELLADELANTTHSTPEQAVRLVEQLAANGAPPEVRDRLTEGFCRRRSAEDVACFLHGLGRSRFDADLGKAIAVTATWRSRTEVDGIKSVLRDLRDQDVLKRIAAATGEVYVELPPSGWFRRRRA